MMGHSDLFVDTNVLIYATNEASRWHQLAIEALQERRRLGIQLVLSAQIVREYLAAATRQRLVDGTPPLPEVLRNVGTFRAEFRLVEDNPRVLDELCVLVRRIPIAGKQIHDANIVATMLAHGVRQLLAHNGTDFARYSHLIEVLPLESHGSIERRSPSNPFE